MKSNDLTQLIKQQSQKTLAIWAGDCAKHVLPYFTRKFPKDPRPQQAINALQAWIKGKMKVGEVRKVAFAAHAAAREARYDPQACAAARAAGQAASTAHVAGHAIHAASYAAKAAKNLDKERDWQYQHLLELIKKNSIDIS